MSFDPLAHRTELMRLDLPDAFSLAGWIEDGGDTLVKLSAPLPAAPEKTKTPKILPLAPCSCVEQVKRVLGLHAPLVFTPRQLFEHLQTLRQKG